jgi:hypothetical protein
MEGLLCFPLTVHEVIQGSEGITPLILSLGARWRWVFIVSRHCEVDEWRIGLKDKRYLHIYKNFSCRTLLVAVRSLCLREFKN